MPIWHGVKQSDVLAIYPLLADIVALDSSLGYENVSRKLVQLIKPEVLTTEHRIEALAKSNDHLAKTLTKDFPGFKISVRSGDVSTSHEERRSRGALATVTRDSVQMDVFLSDPTKIPGGSPSIQLSFTESGLEKLLQHEKTGQAEVLESHEFKFVRANIPFMVPSELEGATLKVGPRTPQIPPIDVRITIELNETCHVLPIMQMSITCMGSESTEFLFKHQSQPFSFVAPFGKEADDGRFSLNVNLEGFLFSQLNTSLRALFDLAAGAKAEVFDIVSGNRLMAFALNPIKTPIDESVLELVNYVSHIEEYFGIAIRWPKRISDEEIDRIKLAYCLCTGKEYGTNLKTRALCPRDSLKTALDSWVEGPTTLLIEPDNRDAISPICGVELPVGRWGFFTEKARPTDIDSVQQAVKSSAESERIEVSFEGLSPTFVRAIANNLE